MLTQMMDTVYNIDRFKMSSMTDNLASVQNTILWIRRVELLIGSSIMLFIIVRICLKKLYVYNTTKMFMWCCIFYFMGMIVILTYVNELAAGNLFIATQISEGNPNLITKTVVDLLKQMSSQNRILCASQSFVNLYFYDMGYFFAILVSYNVKCVIKGNYRKFMRNVLSQRKVIFLLVIMLLMHLLPFIFIFVLNFDDQFFYTYGPTGVRWHTDTDPSQAVNLLEYCGLVITPKSIWAAVLGVINLYICPFIMLFAHSLILFQNSKKTKQLEKEDYLNSKQQFIIVSGKISNVVFFIQLINCIKLIFSLLPIPGQIWDYVLVGINFMFDLYPIVLLVFYLKYTKEKRGVANGSSTILEESLED